MTNIRGHLVSAFIGTAGVLLAFTVCAQSPSTEPIALAELPGITARPDPLTAHPLQPADTSSPRNTLQGFLANVERVFTEWEATGTLSERGYRAYHRASSMLDFSETPDGDSRRIQARRMLLLYEILSRLEVPPEHEIPGEEEVAQGGISQWSIPDTRINIRRLDSGPSAGQFLFTAGTVERLDRYYRLVKELPYQPDSIEGLYEDWLDTKDPNRLAQREVRNRLRPVDLSTPRSTLFGFLDSVTRAHELVREAHAALGNDPPTMTKKQARHHEMLAQNLMDRAITTLDLSQVPKALRDDVGIELALQLKEIFDRCQFPKIDSIPNAAMVAAERRSLREFGTAGVTPVRWRFPNTAIEIVENLEGDRQGSFQFSAATVQQIDGFYHKVRDLPYRADMSHISMEYPDLDPTRGFYKYYISTPGSLIPAVSWLDRRVDALPDWTKELHYGQTRWQWIALVVTILGTILFCMVVWFIFSSISRRLPSPQDRWLRVLSPIVIAWILFGSGHFMDAGLNLTGQVLVAVITASQAIAIVLFGCAAFILSRAISDTAIALPQISDDSVSASLLRLSSSLIGAFLFAYVVIQGFLGLGINMIPLVAGLGVGGLAVALAARPTMENIIGSFMIFADNPYRVGQRIKVLGQDGTVESIGLRSTKIRLLTGHLTSIPNEKMVSTEIENIGRRPYIRRLLNVTVTYDTEPKMVNRAVEILREILSVPEDTEPESTDTAVQATNELDPEANEEREPHPNEAINQEDFPPRVFFNDLNADSLNILVIYWYHPPAYWDYLEHANWINIQIMERFNAEGIEFAFPTQTLYLAGDEKHALTVGQRWESGEETFSPSAVLAQAAALGAQVAQGTQVSASDAVRPQGHPSGEPEPTTKGDFTDAPLEDAFIEGDGEENAPR